MIRKYFMVCVLISLISAAFGQVSYNTQRQLIYVRTSTTHLAKPPASQLADNIWGINLYDSVLYKLIDGAVVASEHYYRYSPGKKKVVTDVTGAVTTPYSTTKKMLYYLESNIAGNMPVSADFPTSIYRCKNPTDSLEYDKYSGVIRKYAIRYPYNPYKKTNAPLVYYGEHNFYVDDSIGNDSYTSEQAHSSITPWKTVSKVNSYASNLLPGDSVLFRAGRTFLGYLNIKTSGTQSNQIVFASYGGGKATITALNTVSGWINKGGNIWESSATNCKNTLSMVTVNGAMTAKGRYPNASSGNGGYNTFESYSAAVSITDNQLSGTPDWDGATLVMRVNKWTIQTKPISNHTGTNITYTGGSTTPQYTSGLGYFIEDDIKTLDSPGEWFLDKTTKKLSVYSISNPGTSVKASIYDTLVKCSNKGYITISNLRFEGANLATMYITDSPNTQVLNCEIDGSGGRGIWAFTNNNFKVEYNTIQNCNSNAMYLSNLNASIRYNTIKNIGRLPGMAIQGTYHAIHLAATPTGTIIQYNSLDSLGSNGVFLMGNNVTVKNNLINHFGLTTDDCGGIYAAGTSYSGKVIDGNIILNGWGNLNGLPSSITLPCAEGIYIDEPATGNYIVNNTVANCRASGLKFHNAYNMTARSNTFYNNVVGTLILKSQANAAYTRNLTFNSNIVVATGSQLAFKIYSYISDDPLLFGSADSNYYCRPVSEGNTIQTRNVNTIVNYDLTGWKAAGKDAHSFASPFTASEILFEYNANTTNKNVPLTGTWKTLSNIPVSGSITIQPYKSIILIR